MVATGFIDKTQILESTADGRPTLSCWSPSYTDLLMSSSKYTSEDDYARKDNSFVLLDNVMRSCDVGSIVQRSDKNYRGKTNEELDFCDNLEQELGVFLDKLRPSRTQGDSRANEILNLLALKTNGDGNNQLQTKQHAVSSARGDKSLFVSREYRRQNSFATNHPFLNHLINTVSNTLDEEFRKKKKASHRTHDNLAEPDTVTDLKLDFSMTSVQVAMYPGDSRSGYHRHCDRGNACRNEFIHDSTTIITESKRLITCIYYLTDKDWDGMLDGGSLRVFDRHDSNDNESQSNLPTSQHIDVIPYRDRLVLFRSDQVEHQVMPSHRRPRLAITIWFYGILHEPKNLTKGSGTAYCRDSIQCRNRQLSQLPISRKTFRADWSDQGNSQPNIFVSIASYRDSEIRPTLDALFSTASDPRRIYVGVVVQLFECEDYDEEIWESIVNVTKQHNSNTFIPQSDQVRYIRLRANDATGPCYARGLCQTLYRGEDFVMQIDSHMRFRIGWDEYLIKTIEQLQLQREEDALADNLDHKEKIVLTTYPVGYELPNNIPNEVRGTYLVPWKFDAYGMLRQRGRLVEKHCLNPISDSLNPLQSKHRAPNSHRQYLYAAGFNFGPGRVIHDVPYDTMGLHHLFFGEELSMAVRLFTHGYDLFAPEETVCFHLWSRAHRPGKVVGLNLKQNTGLLRKQSIEKVRKQLLGDTSMVGKPYGLGSVRTAQDFASRLGVDFHSRTFIRKDWDCGELNPADFVGICTEDDSNASTADILVSNIAKLDSTTMDLIGTFLEGLKG